MSHPNSRPVIPSGSVNSLYRAALLVSGSDEEAARRVEETVRRYQASARTDPDLGALLEILWQVVGSGSGETALLDSAADQALNNGRTQTALSHVRKVIGRSYQQLPRETQLIVMMLEVERLSVGKVAQVVGRSVEDVVRSHERALAAFHDDVFSSDASRKHESLIDDLPDAWLTDAMHHVMEGLGPAPKELVRRLETGESAPAGKQIPPISGPSVERRSSAGDDPGYGKIRFRSVVSALVLVLSVGFGAKYTYELLEAKPNDNVITLVARAAGEFTPDLETESAARLRRFLATHLRDDTPVPLIEGMRLTGVGLDEIAPDVRIVAMKFVDAATVKPVTVYALSYRFLQDQNAVKLSPDVLRQIQSDADFDLHDLGTTKVVVWRHRAHIFFAVTELDGRELRPRVYYPAAPDSS